LPFQAVASQRLYEQVAEQVTALVARGEFKPGDRLPPERDLAKALGVSRPTVREAMIALEIAGLVEVRVGAGTFVTDKNTHDPQFGGAGASPLELIAARRLIEPEVVALAARHATAADLAAIKETLAMTAAAVDTAQHRAADRLFHVRVASASRNGVLAAIADEFWGEMFSPMFERMGAITGLISARCSPRQRDATLSEHDAVYRALEKHDAEAARAAMDRHLSGVEQILAEGEANETQEPLQAAGGKA
jgi:DNA-binding FadR family transcriptional regulator